MQELKGPIDIVVTSYYRHEFTSVMLERLKADTITPHNVIVIDNGSDKRTQNVLTKLKHGGLIHTLILLNQNVGLEPAKNMALNFVESNLYVDTDNDIIIPPIVNNRDWLSRLIELKEKNTDYAAIACRSHVLIGDDMKNFEGVPEVREMAKCGGSMRIMDTKLVKKVGGWKSKPKNMVEANRGEEWEICGKLKAKGFKVGYARDIEVFHMFSDDANWGYPKNIDHYHRPQWPIPTDSAYGQLTEWYERNK